MIVTEFGAAELKGQTLAERTRRLTAIAHPGFREDLEREARFIRPRGLPLRLTSSAKAPDPSCHPYRAVQPPSTTIVWPVTYWLASLASHSTAPVKSSAVPWRGSGVLRRSQFSERSSA